MPPPEAAGSQRLHRSIQTVLRVGLAVALGAMICGVAVRALEGRRDAPPVRLFDLFSARMDPGERLIALGVLALAMTPAARVVALVVLWTRSRDWRFVVVATLVVATLGLGVLLGRG